MGVQRDRNFAKMSRMRKLLRIPATKIKPRHTATTVWPVRLSPPGLWGTVEPQSALSVLMLELERELSVVLKFQSCTYTTMAVTPEIKADEQLDTHKITKSRWTAALRAVGAGVTQV